MTADEIIAAARAVIDTPFRHQGRLPGQALDCAGLVIHVAQTLDIEHIDRSGYSRLPGNGQLESALDSQPGMQRIFTDPLPGDILLMKFGGDPQHLAIFTGETLIHAYQPTGKVCEHYSTAEWMRRVVRVYRFIGVSHG